MSEIGSVKCGDYSSTALTLNFNEVYVWGKYKSLTIPHPLLFEFSSSIESSDFITEILNIDQEVYLITSKETEVYKTHYTYASDPS